MSDTIQNGLTLDGLDGTNPLGFMAALGAFRLLSATHPTLKVAWQVSDGTWHPSLLGIQIPITEFGTELFDALSKLDKSVWSLDKKLPFSASHLRDEAYSAVVATSCQNRERADAVASLGVECHCDDEGNFEDTAFRMVRAGDSVGQGLLAYGKRILESTTAQELQHAVTCEWQHEDDQCALRWDPVEDRRYALQWRDPSKVGALSIKGGNCLALVGLPMFPIVPVKGEATTTGFGLKQSKKSSFTWPIWQHAVSTDTTKSLLTLPMLQRAQPSRSELECRGIVAVYRCDRVMTSTYYANFTPARRVA
jgi:hypothetical protein